MTERLPLFVFGTLRTGECNHGLLVGRFERVLEARLDGYTHVDNPHGYWMIDEREGTSVRGEVFYLKEEIYEEAMVDLDDLEMLPPGEVIGEWIFRDLAETERQIAATYGS